MREKERSLSDSQLGSGDLESGLFERCPQEAPMRGRREPGKWRQPIKVQHREVTAAASVSNLLLLGTGWGGGRGADKVEHTSQL